MKLTAIDYYVLACVFKGRTIATGYEERVSESCRVILKKLAYIEDVREKWDFAFYSRLLSRVDMMRISHVNLDKPPTTVRTRLVNAADMHSLPKFPSQDRIPYPQRNSQPVPCRSLWRVRHWQKLCGTRLRLAHCCQTRRVLCPK